MSFKPNQRVVYVPSSDPHPVCIAPPKGAIITIECASPYYENHYWIKEYKYTHNGFTQSFDACDLRPLDETFADEVLERIKEEINEEQLVRI